MEIRSMVDTVDLVKHLGSLHPTTRYAVEVVSGLRSPICKPEWQACERHLKDLQRQGTDDFPYVFDESRADRIFKWFETCCRHPRGVLSGQLIELNSSQKFDLGSVFGWCHKDTGRRRFKKVYDMQARGNAKSVKASGIANYGMVSDCAYPPNHPEQRTYELSPEVDCVAVDRQQAKIVWEDAVTMGRASTDIEKHLKFMSSVVKHKTRGGMLRPLSKDTKNKNGAAPCIYIIDEYHEHLTSFMYDVGQSSMGKRAQCLMYIITTAGNNAENSPCKKEYDICCKILNGEIVQEDYFVIIRQLDRGDDPHDFKNLPKANPMLQEPTEYSEILLQEIKSEHDLAYGSGDPAKIREWLIKRCDLWQEGSTDKYMDGLMDKWHEAEVSREEFAELTKGLPCLNGDDLSKRTDLTGQAFLFRLRDGRYALKAHGFIPESGVVRHEHSDRIPYRYYAKQGYCTITEGDVIDYDYLIEHAHEEEFDNGINIIEWDLDAALATQVENNLQKQNYTVVEIRQVITVLSEPTKLFREMTIQGKLIHEKNELLDWCVSNAYQFTDGNENIRISKKNKDDSQRVDLLAASINCMARLAAFDEFVGDISDRILSDDFGF
jgi:phage terminase large subunit-like protein